MPANHVYKCVKNVHYLAGKDIPVTTAVIPGVSSRPGGSSILQGEVGFSVFACCTSDY